MPEPLANRETTGFLSTPSARRATPRKTREPPTEKISIHALREEGDGLAGEVLNGHIISIHALREEGDQFGCILSVPQAAFLSTPSARRATPGCRQALRQGAHFYPRPPRGGRPGD